MWHRHMLSCAMSVLLVREASPFPCGRTRSGAGPPTAHPCLSPCQDGMQLHQQLIGNSMFVLVIASKSETGQTVWYLSQLGTFTLQVGTVVMRSSVYRLCSCTVASSTLILSECCRTAVPPARNLTAGQQRLQANFQGVQNFLPP